MPVYQLNLFAANYKGVQMKKLTLNKETIAALNRKQLSVYKGGATLPETELTKCVTYCESLCDTYCFLTNCETCDTLCEPDCPATGYCPTHKCN